MPEVTIEVAKRSYRIGCGEGEEAHAEALAARIDTEATALAAQLGQVSEGRLLLMTSLMLADKLVEAERLAASAQDAADEARRDADAARRDAADAKRLAEAAPQSSDLVDPERDAKIAASLDALAHRIETLAGEVERNA